jgi:hypothetical protein
MIAFPAQKQQMQMMMGGDGKGMQLPGQELPPMEAMQAGKCSLSDPELPLHGQLCDPLPVNNVLENRTGEKLMSHYPCC